MPPPGYRVTVCQVFFTPQPDAFRETLTPQTSDHQCRAHNRYPLSAVPVLRRYIKASSAKPRARDPQPGKNQSIASFVGYIYVNAELASLDSALLVGRCSVGYGVPRCRVALFFIYRIPKRCLPVYTGHKLFHPLS